MICNAPADIKKAITGCGQGSSWQHCRVHCIAPGTSSERYEYCQDVVATALCPVFVQQ